MAQAHAIDALADMGDKSHLELLRLLARDPDAAVRAAAVHGLDDYLPESLPDLEAAAHDPDPRVTRWARLGVHEGR
jgi:HEAT repeat protein